LISDTKLLSPGTAADGRAPTCDNKELTRPDGSEGALVGRAFRSDGKALTWDSSELTKPEGRAEPAATFEGRALIWDTKELSAAAFVGIALRSDTPGTALDGKALIWESSELASSAGGFVGKALMSETKLLIPETPEGKALI
jgi:hypothetical protein